MIECEHHFELNSKIPFTHKRTFICGENIVDYEVCTKCGHLGKVISKEITNEEK